VIETKRGALHRLHPKRDRPLVIISRKEARPALRDYQAQLARVLNEVASREAPDRAERVGEKTSDPRGMSTAVEKSMWPDSVRALAFPRASACIHAVKPVLERRPARGHYEARCLGQFES